ncbi:MAG: HAMP domain-containing sensor histidine kinase [Myxococcota bacterium]
MIEAHAPRIADERESALERAYTDGKIRLLGTFLPMGMALLAIFAPWDYAMSPATAPTTISIRVVLCLMLLLLWSNRATGFLRTWHDWLISGMLTSAGVGVAVILAMVPGGYAAASGGIALVIMFGAGAVRLPAVHTILVSVAITAATAVCMVVSGETSAMILSNVMMLSSFGMLGVFYNVATRRDALEILESQARLRHEKAQTDFLLRQVTTMRQERFTWLENLARFLKHELSNQIVAVSTSIDLAKGDGSRFGIGVYLERAQRSLNRMRGLVSSATEATSLEAALAVEEIGKVDWSAVIVERVSAFQQLHPSRDVVLTIRPGLRVDGNEDRLAQLLDKLLNNALEHSPEGAEIRVELRQTQDGWVELKVDNTGDPLPEDKERIFEAFVSSQGRPENLGLGLFVAQSIARNHGGHVHAKDLPGRRGASFVVTLPRSPAGHNEHPKPEAPREEEHVAERTGGYDE